MPSRTVLLVFIHGFKGDDDTFAAFPQHLQALLSHALPTYNIVQTVYPRFETRGELADAAHNFRDWLQNKVIDLEVASGTPAPTVDPRVRAVIVGHSMGGIVGAETVLAITRDRPVVAAGGGGGGGDGSAEENVAFMFPSILGLLAFDTPYLGLSPGVIAHGAESHYQNIKGAWSAYNTVTSAFSSSSSTCTTSQNLATAAKALPAASSSSAAPSAAGAAGGGTAAAPWQKWSKYALYATAASAVLASGAAAAYASRAHLSAGWSWATSHLAFVGCLARGAELEQRVAAIEALADHRTRGAGAGFGWRTVFTQLGRGAGTLVWQDASRESGGSGGGESSSSTEGGDTWAHALVGSERTFCLLPKQQSARRARFFVAAVNDKASSEIGAHMNMFTPRENPGYYAMSELAKETIALWVRRNWYAPEEEEEGQSGGKERRAPLGEERWRRGGEQGHSAQRPLFERRRDESEEPDAAIPRDDTQGPMHIEERQTTESAGDVIKREDLETNPWA